MSSEPGHDEIRRKIRAARRAVSQQSRAEWSGEQCRRVAELSSFQQAEQVAGFLAFDGESDPLALMTTAVEQGKQVFVPIIVAKAQPLLFAPWNPDSKLKPNRFGILEPDVSKTERIPASQLDFVITPLVAFDEACNRIGVGGGFYDRSFAFLKESKCSNPICMVGFAFELQKVGAIKQRRWDVRLNEIVTESSRYVDSNA